MDLKKPENKGALTSKIAELANNISTFLKKHTRLRPTQGGPTLLLATQLFEIYKTRRIF